MRKLITTLFFIYSFAAFGQNCITNTNSLEFSSAYISTNANTALDITDSITIEAWVNSNAWAVTPAGNSIVCKHGWSSSEAGYVLRAGGSGQLSFNIGGTDTVSAWREVVSTAGSLQLNTWYHVAGTFDGNSMKIYINGVIAGTLPFVGTITPSPNYIMKIGKLSDTQPETRYWSGLIDEVRIWHRVLTASELLANMNHHLDTANAVDLVGYWRFNEGTGATVNDLSHSNNNGTIMNATWSTNVPFGNGPPTPFITHGGPNLYSSALSGNQWYINGTIIPGETGSTFTPITDGSYTVTVTDSAGCSSTSLPFVVTTLGINENYIGQLLIGQNYSDGILTFSSSADVLRKAELNLFDVNGRSVLHIEKGDMKNELNLRSLSAGVYISHINIDDLSFQKRIAVN